MLAADTPDSLVLVPVGVGKIAALVPVAGAATTLPGDAAGAAHHGPVRCTRLGAGEVARTLAEPGPGLGPAAPLQDEPAGLAKVGLGHKTLLVSLLLTPTSMAGNK